MFTVVFAIGRTVGWIAHWKEMISDPENKIGRPRQRYNGKKERKFVAVETREQGKESALSGLSWLWRG